MIILSTFGIKITENGVVLTEILIQFAAYIPLNQASFIVLLLV